MFHIINDILDETRERIFLQQSDMTLTDPILLCLACSTASSLLIITCFLVCLPVSILSACLLDSMLMSELPFHFIIRISCLLSFATFSSETERFRNVSKYVYAIIYDICSCAESVTRVWYWCRSPWRLCAYVSGFRCSHHLLVSPHHPIAIDTTTIVEVIWRIGLAYFEGINFTSLRQVLWSKRSRLEYKLFGYLRGIISSMREVDKYIIFIKRICGINPNNITPTPLHRVNIVQDKHHCPTRC